MEPIESMQPIVEEEQPPVEASPPTTVEEPEAPPPAPKKKLSIDRLQKLKKARERASQVACWCCQSCRPLRYRLAR